MDLRCLDGSLLLGRGRWRGRSKLRLAMSPSQWVSPSLRGGCVSKANFKSYVVEWVFEIGDEDASRSRVDSGNVLGKRKIRHGACLLRRGGLYDLYCAGLMRQGSRCQLSSWKAEEVGIQSNACAATCHDVHTRGIEAIVGSTQVSIDSTTSPCR